MDNSASLWRTESSAHTVPRTGRVLPSYVPRFGVVSHRGCWQFRVTAFTRRSDRARDVAEQWTVMWRSCLLLGTTDPNLWVQPWTTLRTGCGRSSCPHPVEIVHPRIHNPLSCTDAQPPASLWTQLGTTSQSPACGRKKVGKSVEGGRNRAVNRTQGCWEDTGVGSRRGDAEGSSGSDRGWKGLSGTGRRRRVAARRTDSRSRRGGMRVSGERRGRGRQTSRGGAPAPSTALPQGRRSPDRLSGGRFPQERRRAPR